MNSLHGYPIPGHPFIPPPPFNRPYPEILSHLSSSLDTQNLARQLNQSRNLTEKSAIMIQIELLRDPGHRYQLQRDAVVCKKIPAALGYELLSAVSQPLWRRDYRSVGKILYKPDCDLTHCTLVLPKQTSCNSSSMHPTSSQTCSECPNRLLRPN